jgi:hypothetical protein
MAGTKVSSPAGFHSIVHQMLQPSTIAYLTQAVEKELKRIFSSAPQRIETRESGWIGAPQAAGPDQRVGGGFVGTSVNPQSDHYQEKTIANLEREVNSEPDERPQLDVEDLPDWIDQQLADLGALLKSDIPRVKSEFRRLNLQLTFHPTEAQPRPHYIVKGQCDLSALAFSFLWSHAGTSMPFRDLRGRRRSRRLTSTMTAH